MHMRHLARYLIAAVASLALAPSAGLANLVSTTNDEVIDGLPYMDGDVLSYDVLTGSATVEVAELDLFADDENINALAIAPTGHLIFSISDDTGSMAGGVFVRDGDLAAIDPDTGVVSMYLPSSVYGEGVDVDAVHVMDDGRVLVSFRANELVHGVNYLDGDVIAFDNGAFSIFFSESNFEGDADINAFSITYKGTYLISTRKSATLAGVTFGDGEILEYDPVTQTAQIVFSVNNGGADVDALVAQLPACFDGIDNDGDGLVDFGEDAGCTDADDVGEIEEILPCDDGIDNDEDGLTDYPADPGCGLQTWVTESPECSDGIDNDGNGFVDFPEDENCVAVWDFPEARDVLSCGLGFELVGILPLFMAVRRLRRQRR
jgi:hypothetical protein